MKKNRRHLSIAQRIALSFILVILVGSLLLSLPFCQVETSSASYFDNLFNSVSAVCVTGLFSQPVYASYNLIGQIIFLVMIQLGGIGLMTVIAMLMIGAGKSLRFRDKQAISEALNRSSLSDFKEFVISIFTYTFCIEGFGFLVLAPTMVKEVGLGPGLFRALFTSVSSFCNAGFDNFNASSLQSYATNGWILWPVMILITLGGLGFSVWFDMTQNMGRFFKRTGRGLTWVFRHLKVHSKLVLKITAGLIMSFSVLVFILERNNPLTLAGLPLGQQVMQSTFQVVTHRTAGFSILDLSLLRPATILILMICMLVGASPGGTGGGIKTTSVWLVVLLVTHELTNQKNINTQRRTISRSVVVKALVIFLLFLACSFVATCLLTLFDPDKPLLALAYEAISAISTTGVSMNLTPSLSRASQVVLMILMFLGRLGPITIFLALSHQEDQVTTTYAQADILIG